MDLLSVTQFAAPVALAAVGEVVVQRSGVINIGLEGAMLNGAFLGMLGSYQTHNPWVGLVYAIIGGLATSLVFGLFTIGLACDQVVIGTAVDLLAMGLTGTVYRQAFGQTGTLLSVDKLPQMGGVDPIEVAMVLGVLCAWFLMRKTGWGLAVRAAGEYPLAAEAAGFSIFKLRIQALIFGGIFAGAAGAYLSLVISGSFSENMTAGRGFIAIAMVTFGRWNPLYAFAASLLIGFAGSLQFWFQSKGWHIPYQFFVAMPYMLALLVLIFVGKGAHAPKSLAVPYPSESA